MTSCSDAQLTQIQQFIAGANFSDTKKAYLKTVCQNFTFTTKQAAALLAPFSFSSDKKSAVEELRHSLIDPKTSEPIVSLFDSSSDKEAAASLLASFPATKAQQLAPLQFEKDGQRDAASMQRLFDAMDAVSMSSDKVKAVEDETTAHPSPPFNATQVVEIMKKLSFSNDAAKVLAMFVGPKIVYPMTCAQVIAVLDVFKMSNDKLAVLPALKSFIYDAQNKLSIVASFSFSNDKEKAEVILRDVVVNFKPPTPPEAPIQKALKAIGKCPSGYMWRKVSGGWRCSAGGHYVSDAKLQEHMSG